MNLFWLKLKYILILVCAALTAWGASQTLGEAKADIACNSLVTNNVCGQAAYDNCSLQYDGNRAFYDCRASANPNCQGRIYCGFLDRSAAGNPAPVNAALTCDAVNKITTCNQTTYDNCSLGFDGNRAFYDCHANQNPNCQGRIFCADLDRNTQPAVTPTPAPQGGANANATVSCPAGSAPQQNSQGTTVCVANANANNNNNSNTSSSSSTAIAQGGSANVSISQPAGATPAAPRMVTAGSQEVKQLPKTGLPAIAWAAGAFIPLGFRIKKYGASLIKGQDQALSLWEERKFKSQA